MSIGKIAVIMGSKSDLPIMQDAVTTVQEFGLECEVSVVSAHRTPERMVAYAKSARERGVIVIIAGAGGAAHLPGMVASLTTLPVIGVPVKSSNSIEGIDSLLSIVQMPGGIPVATVAVNGAKNAGLLAVRILACQNKKIESRLEAYMKSLVSKVEKQISELESQGFEQPDIS